MIAACMFPSKHSPWLFTLNAERASPGSRNSTSASVRVLGSTRRDNGPLRENSTSSSSSLRAQIYKQGFVSRWVRRVQLKGHEQMGAQGFNDEAEAKGWQVSNTRHKQKIQGGMLIQPQKSNLQLLLTWCAAFRNKLQTKKGGRREVNLEKQPDK